MRIKRGPGRGGGKETPASALLASLDLPPPVKRVSLAPTSARTIEGAREPSGGRFGWVTPPQYDSCFLSFQALLSFCPQVSDHPPLGTLASPTLYLSPWVSPLPRSLPLSTRASRARDPRQLRGVRVCSELGSRRPCGAALSEPAHGVDARPAARPPARGPLGPQWRPGRRPRAPTRGHVLGGRAARVRAARQRPPAADPLRLPGRQLLAAHPRYGPRDRAGAGLRGRGRGRGAHRWVPPVRSGGGDRRGAVHL